MISIRKIETLSPRTRLRKLGGAFHKAYLGEVDEEYLDKARELLLRQDALGEKDRKDIACFYSKGPLGWEDIYHRILSLLGEAPADWDVTDERGSVDWEKRLSLPHILFLDRIRSPYNVGSIFRSAEEFAVERIVVAPGTASPLHQRSIRVSRGAVDGVPWEEGELDAESLPVFALEKGGADISSFHFPKTGICIVGSEESGVSPERLRAADSSLGRVGIPQYGVKGSLSVSSAVAILLYEWMEAERKGLAL